MEGAVEFLETSNIIEVPAAELNHLILCHWFLKSD
jgi:hypothetical protein